MELLLCCLHKSKHRMLFEISTLIQHSSLIKVWIYWLTASPPGLIFQLHFWAFIKILSQNMKRSRPQNPRAFTQTLIAPKLTFKIPTDLVEGWCGHAYHRCRYLPPTGQKRAIKSCEQKEMTIAWRKCFFHSSTVAVKSLRQQTGGWDAVVPQEKSKAGLNNMLITQNLLTSLWVWGQTLQQTNTLSIKKENLNTMAHCFLKRIILNRKRRITTTSG